MRGADTVSVERAIDADSHEILAVQRLAYASEAALYDDPHIPPLTETAADLTRSLASGVVLVARAGRRIVGAVRGRLDADTCHVGRLCVHPDFQGRGIATALLAAIEAAVPAERYALFTGHRSAANLRLYERLGYAEYRREPVADHVTLVHLAKAPA